MRLGLLAMQSVVNVNNFSEVLNLSLTQGNPGTMYFRLVDLDQLVNYYAGSGYPYTTSAGNGYLRFIPDAGSTMVVNINNQNPAVAVLQRVASQPFAGDASVWSFPILNTDPIGFGSISAQLTMGGVTYNLQMISSIAVNPSGGNQFYC